MTPDKRRLVAESYPGKLTEKLGDIPWRMPGSSPLCGVGLALRRAEPMPARALDDLENDIGLGLGTNLAVCTLSGNGGSLEHI